MVGWCMVIVAREFPVVFINYQQSDANYVVIKKVKAASYRRKMPFKSFVEAICHTVGWKIVFFVCNLRVW